MNRVKVKEMEQVFICIFYIFFIPRSWRSNPDIFFCFILTIPFFTEPGTEKLKVIKNIKLSFLKWKIIFKIYEVMIFLLRLWIRLPKVELFHKKDTSHSM